MKCTITGSNARYHKYLKKYGVIRYMFEKRQSNDTWYDYAFRIQSQYLFIYVLLKDMTSFSELLQDFPS